MSDDYGLEQAKAQFESIAAMVGALEVDYDALDDLRDEFEELSEYEIQNWRGAGAYSELLEAANGCESRDAAIDRIQEDPLSVEVRSDWASPGEPMEAAEFRILLCTGGPAVQLVGELDEYKYPTRAWLEYQDWGTPWTRYYVKDGQTTLLAYAQQFYFGE